MLMKTLKAIMINAAWNFLLGAIIINNQSSFCCTGLKVLIMTLNYILWWDSISGALRIVEYSIRNPNLYFLLPKCWRSKFSVITYTLYSQKWTENKMIFIEKIHCHNIKYRMKRSNCRLFCVSSYQRPAKWQWENPLKETKTYPPDAHSQTYYTHIHTHTH